MERLAKGKISRDGEDRASRFGIERMRERAAVTSAHRWSSVLYGGTVVVGRGEQPSCVGTAVSESRVGRYGEFRKPCPKS